MSELSIRFGQVDPVAKQDIVDIIVTPIKPWSVIDNLRFDGVPVPPNYATNEHNFSILDGSKQHFPDEVSPLTTFGFWSEGVSDDFGSFGDSPPTLDIYFGANHKSLGVTYYFYPHTDDYANRIRVTWYDSSNTIIHTGEYPQTSNLAIVSQSVLDYRRIKTEFLSTNIRNRFIKLYAIDFGIIRTFYDAEISSCYINEEIDPTVKTLSINTMNAKIRTRNSIFSPIMSENFDDMMMKRQLMQVYKDSVLYGAFFLTKWKDSKRSGIEFSVDTEDAISIFDLYAFTGGLYIRKPAIDLLNELFGIVFPTGLIGYQIDPSLSDSTVTGWIPSGTCGEALQHILFAIHAIADTSRREYIWIYDRDTVSTLNIPLERQYRKGQDEPTEYFSGVEVISYSYTPGTEVRQLFKDVLTVGRHRISFRNPMHSLEVTEATIIESHVNYAILVVPVETEVLLEGSVYIENQQSHIVREEVTAGEIDALKKFDDFTLVSPETADYLAQKQFELLHYRIKSTTDIALDDKEVGYVATMETKGRSLEGLITGLDIDLRANSAEMVVIGNAVT